MAGKIIEYRCTNGECINVKFYPGETIFFSCDKCSERMVDVNSNFDLKSVAEKINATPIKMMDFEDILVKHNVPTTDEITIKMVTVDKPPIVMLNGKAIEGVIELNYQYKTKTPDAKGSHNFNIGYCDKETNTIRIAAAKQVFEDE